ncbi:glycoside hydrolase family 32 protein [Tumebacillus sp. ITR2]|uniref:Sucrose-6-phosphate hydrolase n=1 Tax=Tumebacillus amylolyticus TaxID=2801339 RepID=A0ABS1J6T9_9BACL|nr:glycoside hydrolase family 32 protein [Tumebacillus amylolyticus]MBL0385774.1 glycoside hydrolase family 32 protein [Tumebacillus amylolyticus]
MSRQESQDRHERHQDLARDAERRVTQAAQKTLGSHRLAYHIMAPANWINDPNGLIQYKGEYHVFYQHHPDSPKWGPMHWGHVRSKDLVHWERLPIALAPSEEYDRDGCFSGCAVVNDAGELTLIYTGNVWTNEQETELRQQQCLATSRDGVTFTKDAEQLQVPDVPFDCQGHLRDPKVWKEGDLWYMILGTREDNDGKVVLYRSQNLRDWSYMGVAAESDGTLGYMWECPDLFSLNGKEVLVFSPQGMEPQGDLYQNLHQTGYLVGHLDYETGRLEHGAFTELDKGFDFYAAQTFLDEQGRRILIGWMDMWESAMPTQEYGWAGALTIPRLLELTDEDRLLMKPVPELEALRGEGFHAQDVEVSSGTQVLQSVKGDAFEVLAEFDLTTCEAETFGIKVRCSEEGAEETVVSFSRQTSTLTFDRNRSGAGVAGVRRAQLHGRDQQTLRLHLFVDRSSLEVFANDGVIVLTGRIYPNEASQGVHLFAEGGSVKLLSLDVWKLS